MAAASDFLEQALLQHVLRGDTVSTSYAQPATVYAALFTAGTDLEINDQTNEVGTGTGSYARQVVAFAAPVGNAVSNEALVEFLDMPSTTVTHVAICDSLTGGQILFHSALTASKTTALGDTLSFAIGDLTVTLD